MGVCMTWLAQKSTLLWHHFVSISFLNEYFPLFILLLLLLLLLLLRPQDSLPIVFYYWWISPLDPGATSVKMSAAVNSPRKMKVECEWEWGMKRTKNKSIIATGEACLWGQHATLISVQQEYFMIRGRFYIDLTLKKQFDILENMLMFFLGTQLMRSSVSISTERLT